jgi:hypothetical protein
MDVPVGVGMLGGGIDVIEVAVGTNVGVAVGGTDVPVGIGMFVGGIDVAVGASGVSVGGTGVAGGSTVSVGGKGVAVGATGVPTRGAGEAVGSLFPQPTIRNRTANTTIPLTQADMPITSLDA